MVAASAGPVAPGDDLPPEAAGFMAVALAGAGITYLLGITATQAFVTARLRNLVWSGLTIGSYRCTSTMRTWPFVRILVTNLLGMVVTLGLFWPFAQVRLTRYLASTLSIEGPADFAEFHSGSSPEEQAVGEEVSEFFDFDIGF